MANPFVIIPIGAVLAFAGEITSEAEANLMLGGWLPCDGRPLPNSGDYTDLFDTIGKSHGEGRDDSGAKSGDFNLPDYRGRFLRGVSGLAADRDKGLDSRTAMRAGGNIRGGVGSLQDDSTRMPANAFRTGNAIPPNHHHGAPTWNGQSGPFEVPQGAFGVDYGAQSAPTTDAGDHRHDIVGGDPETRSVNAYVNYIIKFKQV